MCFIFTEVKYPKIDTLRKLATRYMVDNRVTNEFVKLKIRQVQFFTNSSNLNAVNNTRYTVTSCCSNLIY